MYAVTLDQRRSRSSADLVRPWQETLNEEFTAGLRLPFARTAGDEMQALFTDAKALVDVVLRAMDDGNWWIGVGIGDPNPLGDTARESLGPAFQYARTAVSEAKRRDWQCAVHGDPEWASVAADGALGLLAYMRRRRARAVNELIEAAARGTRQVQLAQDLGVTPQAVSKRLKTAGFEQELRGRDALVRILHHVRWT